MMSESWIDIGLDEFSTPKSKEINGVGVEVMISPFDIPSMVRACRGGDDSKVSIEFGYIAGQEPTKEERKQEGITFCFGKNSERILKILIDTDRFGSKHFDADDLLAAVKSIEALSKERSNSKRTGNYEAVRHTLAAHSADIVKTAEQCNPA